MAKGRLIVWANKKGGVGKTTLAVHNAVWLHDLGGRTALLDADEQRSSSQWIASKFPEITIKVTTSPNKCVPIARELLESHDFVVADAPGGTGEITRTLLILADLAVFPITPSILDVWSVAEAIEVLRYAQGINEGRPLGRLVLNKVDRRTTISRELREAAPQLGLAVVESVVRDLQIYRDAAQQGTVAARLGRKGRFAAREIDEVCAEILTGLYEADPKQWRQLVKNG